MIVPVLVEIDLADMFDPDPSPFAPAIATRIACDREPEGGCGGVVGHVRSSAPPFDLCRAHYAAWRRSLDA